MEIVNSYNNIITFFYIWKIIIKYVLYVSLLEG